MSETAHIADAFKINSLKVSCDGGSSTLGHPRIFLAIRPERGDVVCPYCNKRYILELSPSSR